MSRSTMERENGHGIKIQCLGGYIPDQVVTCSPNQRDPKTEGKKGDSRGRRPVQGSGAVALRPIWESTTSLSRDQNKSPLQFPTL